VVTDSDVDSSSTLEMHKDAWVGAINLPEDQACLLRQMFKCVICHSNDHTLPCCPLMKNWVIKKKLRPDGNTTSDSDSQSKVVGGVNSVVAPREPFVAAHPTELSPSLSLSSIAEEPEVSGEVQDDFLKDHTGSVEFDRIANTTSLGLMDISETVTPYFAFKTPTGSVRSVVSSQAGSYSRHINALQQFQLIVDSGCT